MEKRKVLEDGSVQQLDRVLYRILGPWNQPLSLLLWGCGLRDQQFIGVGALFQFSLKDMMAAMQGTQVVERDEWLYVIHNLHDVLKKMTHHYQHLWQKVKALLVVNNTFVIELSKALSIIESAAQSAVLHWYKSYSAYRLQSMCMLSTE